MISLAQGAVNRALAFPILLVPISDLHLLQLLPFNFESRTFLTKLALHLALHLSKRISVLSLRKQDCSVVLLACMIIPA